VVLREEVILRKEFVRSLQGRIGRSLGLNVLDQTLDDVFILRLPLRTGALAARCTLVCVSPSACVPFTIKRMQSISS
jgi:hypothetical protein